MPKKATKKRQPVKIMPGSKEFAVLFSELFLDFMESFKKEYGENLNSTVSCAALIQVFENDDPAMVAGGTTRQLFDLCAHIVCYITQNMIQMGKNNGHPAVDLAPILGRDIAAKAQQIFMRANALSHPPFSHGNGNNPSSAGDSTCDGGPTPQ